MTLSDFLKNELQQRKKNNSLYSLRSFAQFLEVNPGTLSSVLKGKRKLPLLVAERACNKLNLCTSKKNELLFSEYGDNFNPEKLECFIGKNNVLESHLTWKHESVMILMEQGICDLSLIARILNLSSTDVMKILEELYIN